MFKQAPLPNGQTTTDLIADALRTGILHGDFPEGSELIQEIVAEQYGVSRVPLREAMRRLEAEGLITFRANRGAFVTQLSFDDLREIYELRMLIEGDLIHRAAKVLTANELRRAETIHGRLETEDDPNEQNALNREFHSVIYAAARRPKQEALVQNLRNLVERYQNIHRSLMASTRSFQKDHKKILTALRQRNPNMARAVLVEHLNHAMKVALEHLSKQKHVQSLADINRT
jgi:DNA-binding GntR family transcriptional regulator